MGIATTRDLGEVIIAMYMYIQLRSESNGSHCL
jgi:hypothetical protein